MKSVHDLWDSVHKEFNADSAFALPTHTSALLTLAGALVQFTMVFKEQSEKLIDAVKYQKGRFLPDIQ